MYDIETRTLDEQHTAVVRSRMDASELTSWLSGVHGTVLLHLQRIGVATTGEPFVRYHERGDHVDVEAGVPIEQPITPTDEVAPSTLPAGPVAATWHRGSPDDLAPAFEALEVWTARTGDEPAGAAWTVHHVDPTVPPEAGTWTIEVIQPLRA